MVDGSGLRASGFGVQCLGVGAVVSESRAVCICA